MPDPQPAALRGLAGVVVLGLLIAAGLAGNHFKFTIFFNADFIFGSIFAMLALQMFGMGRGTAAALIISSFLFLLWGHPYATVIMTAEVASVGWLHSRHKVGFIQADALYWLLLGMPLVYLFYHLVMKVPTNNTLFIMAKDMVNGVANVLVARLIFMTFALSTRKESFSYREVVYLLLALFVMCPPLIMLATESREDFNRTDGQIRNTLLQSSQRMSDRVETWALNRKSAISYLAGLAASRSPQQMQPCLDQAKLSDVNFLRIGLLDKDAIVTAYHPLLDETGHPNIGKSFADRPFLPTLKRTLKPMLSEVVMGRIGTPKPMVTMLAPVVSHGEFGGYVSGILSMEQVREHFVRGTDETAMLYTLLDKNGSVIMTNRAEQKVMEPFMRGKGSLNRLDDRMSQWVPTMPPNTPAMERWGKSFYVAESRIGQLAEWKLILEQPVLPFQKALYGSYSQKMLMILLLFMAALAAAELLSRRLTHSFEQLGDLTRDLPTRLVSDGQAIHWPTTALLESNQLISNFRQMAGSLTEQFDKVRHTNETLEQTVEERTRELQHERWRLESIIEGTHVGTWEWNVQTGETVFGHGWAHILGYSLDELVPASIKTWERLAHPDDLKLSAVLLERHFVGESPYYECECRMKHKDGHWVWVHDRGCVITHTDDGKPLMMFGTHTDISARKQAEAVKQEALDRIQKIASQVPGVVFQYRLRPDGSFCVPFASEALREIYRVSPEDVRDDAARVFATHHPDDRDDVVASLRASARDLSIWKHEYRVKFDDGTVRSLYGNAVPQQEEDGSVLWHGFVTDVTDRKRLEAQLHQSQKMESLGILAGGVAHDMNNVLGAILGLSSVHLETHPPGSPEHRAFTTISKACTRGAELIQSLLSFARQGLAEEKILDLNALVRDEARLLERTTLAKVHLELDLASNLRPILGDASALTHVLMNLCINAVDAMPDNGTLTLRTRNADKGWIEVLVEDTGSGMSQEVLEKALDPFFTTKEQGKGTGLGLSIAHSTVTAHRGQLDIQSVVGQGTRVMLRFPSCESEVPALEATPESPREAPLASLKVLLVDDDELIQSSMQSILEILGHSVTLAPSGEDALVKVETGLQPDVVILDMNMPGLGGAGTLPRLRELLPTVPIFLATGRVDQTALNLVEAQPHVTLLSKPFGIKELQQLLDPLRRS